MDADDLYRLAPEDFTAARDAEVKERKAAGDKEGAAALEALRKPSVAAWLVNRLAADQPGLLGQLLDLGPELAQAQSGRDAGALRELGAQRAWQPRPLPRPLTASAGSQASAVLDASAARAALDQEALEDAMRRRADAQRPPSIQSARLARTASDAEIEAHVRELLARRAVGQ